MTLPKPIKFKVERYIGGLSQLKKIDNPIKLSANESALGPSPKALEAFQKDKDKVFLKKSESDSGYLKILFFSFSNASIAFGLGPKADSLADNFIGLSIFLNLDNPPIYLSTLNFIGFGKLINCNAKYYICSFVAKINTA